MSIITLFREAQNILFLVPVLTRETCGLRLHVSSWVIHQNFAMVTVIV